MTGSGPVSLASAEGSLQKFEAEAAAPGPREASWILAWSEELGQLDAFAAGLVEGRSSPAGTAELGLAAAGFVVGAAEVGTALSVLGLALGWIGLFMGLGSWIRSAQEADEALALQRRVLQALLRLEDLA